MSDLVLEPTTRRETFIAQEANKVNGFEIVAAAAVQGGVGLEADGETFKPPSIGKALATDAPAGDVNLFKQQGFSSLTWEPNTGTDANDQLNNSYKATFLAKRPDVNYQVHVTITEPDAQVEGYGIIARISEKTVEGFTYKLFLVPDGSTVSAFAEVAFDAAPTFNNNSDLPAATNIPVFSTQFGHDVLVVDF
jgi:hypothetical protein